MSAEEQARVAREIDSNVRQSLVRGTEDLWKRLRDVVSHMVDRLNEPESRFHATLVTNIFDLVELLPKLNVTGDSELNRFAEEARQKLCTYTAHDLRSMSCCAWRRRPRPPDSSPVWMRKSAIAGPSRLSKALLRSRASSTICRRTWRCPRRHETRCHYNHKLAGDGQFMVAVPVVCSGASDQGIRRKLFRSQFWRRFARIDYHVPNEISGLVYGGCIVYLCNSGGTANTCQSRRNAAGPTIVAFFPNASKAGSDNADSNEALSDFQFYAERVKEPLNQLGIRFTEQFGGSFRIRSGSGTRLFIPKAETPGYYFTGHGKQPHIEYGVLTDIDLLALAKEYFGASHSPDASIATEPTTSLPGVFGSVVAEVKTKSRITVLLPSELSQPVAGAKYAVVEKASEGEYAISLYYEMGIGNAGFAALFAAQADPATSLKNCPMFEKLNCLRDLSAISDRLAAGDLVHHRTSGGKRIVSCIKSS